MYTNRAGDRFEGIWKDDVKHGKGKFVYANGDVYEGEFANNMNCGIGKFIGFDGGTVPNVVIVVLANYVAIETYEGSWVDGKMHGSGVFVDKNGNKYKGEWEAGKRKNL